LQAIENWKLEIGNWLVIPRALVAQTPFLGLRFVDWFLAPLQAIATTSEKPQIPRAGRGLRYPNVPRRSLVLLACDA
jgi:hypothetical protein